jgi:hypothetical protein
LISFSEYDNVSQPQHWGRLTAEQTSQIQKRHSAPVSFALLMQDCLGGQERAEDTYFNAIQAAKIKGVPVGAEAVTPGACSDSNQRRQLLPWAQGFNRRRLIGAFLRSPCHIPAKLRYSSEFHVLVTIP